MELPRRLSVKANYKIVDSKIRFSPFLKEKAFQNQIIETKNEKICIKFPSLNIKRQNDICLTHFKFQNSQKGAPQQQISRRSSFQDNSDRNDDIHKLREIKRNIIGYNSKYSSPFGYQLNTLYLDHTATNRPYASIQSNIQYIKKYVGNPHTEYSYSGKFSESLLNYSQKSLLKSFSAADEQYYAIPIGNGSTAAIQKSIKIIQQIQKSNNFQLVKIFLSKYQHHSNLLPWIQFYDNVNPLPSQDYGKLAIQKIQSFLQQQCFQLGIITISASSNVTSQITDLQSMNQIIKTLRKKKKNIIFCVDSAAYTPHKQLNLTQLGQIDFVYISPHKNLGGSQACGILIGKKSIYKNLKKPTFPGGGTVQNIKGYEKDDIIYIQSGFRSQTAGTPPLIGFYRAALSFELLYEIGYNFINKQQKQKVGIFVKLIEQINIKLKDKNKKIHLYGDQNFQNRGNVITFNIFNNQNPVYYNLASLLFTHIFGIQFRSGIFCAGLFAKQLLEVNDNKMDQIQSQIKMDIVNSKPGYIRLDIPFYIEKYEIEYIAKSIQLVALYNQNMCKIYSVLYNGFIKIHHLLHQNNFNQMFGLNSNGSFIQNQFEKYHKVENDIDQRERKLSEQLLKGEMIMKNPISFLKTLQQLESFYD